MPEFFGIPASPFALGLGVNESAILRVLAIARRLIERGWCQHVPWCDVDGLSIPGAMGPASHFSIAGAIQTAGAGELVCQYALRLLKEVLGEVDLHAWNDNPVRTRAEVLGLFDRTVERASGRAARRGGWAVSS